MLSEKSDSTLNQHLARTRETTPETKRKRRLKRERDKRSRRKLKFSIPLILDNKANYMIGVSDACPAALQTNKNHLINTDWLPRMHLLHPMFYNIKHAKKDKNKKEN